MSLEGIHLKLMSMVTRRIALTSFEDGSNAFYIFLELEGWIKNWIYEATQKGVRGKLDIGSRKPTRQFQM